MDDKERYHKAIADPADSSLIIQSSIPQTSGSDAPACSSRTTTARFLLGATDASATLHIIHHSDTEILWDRSRPCQSQFHHSSCRS